MARIERKAQKIFAGNATNSGVFGSLQTGDPAQSTDIETLQSLEAYDNGWNDATISGDLLPALEEMQALEYIDTTQIAYIFQEGIAEWNAETEYYIGSLVKVITGENFIMYRSTINSNIGNSPATSASAWVAWYDSTAEYVLTSTDQTIGGVKTFTSNLIANTYINVGVDNTLSSSNSYTRVNAGNIALYGSTSSSTNYIDFYPGGERTTMAGRFYCNINSAFSFWGLGGSSSTGSYITLWPDVAAIAFYRASSGGQIQFCYNGSSVTSTIRETASGTITVSGSLRTGSALTVTGATTLNSSLSVSGTTSLSSTTTINGATTFNSTVARSTTLSSDDSSTQIPTTAWVNSRIISIMDNTFQVVSELPSSPSSDVYYFIPEE